MRAASLFPLLLCTVTARADFRDDQERAPRVKAARQRATDVIQGHYRAAGVAYPGRVHLRAFKGEGVVELWAGPDGQELKRVRSFAVCARSGGLGPKRKEGDGQVPEGFYQVDRFNPYSNFHLSLGVSYPNAADRVRNKGNRLGGDIFVHGNCVTIGCLPLRDGPIEELYVAVLDARLGGQKSIPVHIFPHRMDDEGMKWLRALGPDDALWAFWEELRPGYDAFERTHRVPRVVVDRAGHYVVR
ncbi:MAG: hypothetical protein HY904_24030 [Deltaproteobacteria bacterium]|nr:hypothetical protein [Deltaproteobacteria bacterium]